MHIICHMISSVDGRLRSSAWSRSADPVDISAVYESAARRFSSDGWIVGRTTMAEYGEGVTESQPAEPRPADSPAPLPFAGRREGRPLAVVFDPKGRLHFAASSLPTGEHLTAVLSPNVGDAHLEALRRAGVSYVFEGRGSERSRLSEALASLEALFGVHTLLLEGGGILNGSFLEADLIDEVSLLIYPGIDGVYGSPAVFGRQCGDGPSPSRHVRLKLIETEPLPGGVVWLHYENRRSA